MRWARERFNAPHFVHNNMWSVKSLNFLLTASNYKNYSVRGERITKIEDEKKKKLCCCAIFVFFFLVWNAFEKHPSDIILRRPKHQIIAVCGKEKKMPFILLGSENRKKLWNNYPSRVASLRIEMAGSGSRSGFKSGRPNEMAKRKTNRMARVHESQQNGTRGEVLDKYMCSGNKIN